MKVTHLHIPLLESATDTGHLEKALEAVPRVTAVEVESDHHQIRVEHEGADSAQLTWAVLKLGYPAEAR